MNDISPESGARAAAIIDFVDVIRELGADPEPMLGHEGLTLGDLLDPERIVPAETVGRLLITGVEATGFAHLGAMLACRRDLRSYLGTLGRLVWSAPDLGSALREFARFISIHISGSHWHLDEDGTLARLRNTFDQIPMRPAIEHNLVLVCRLIKALTFEPWSPSLVYMTTPEPAKTSYMRRLFDCPMLFDAPFNGIEFHASDLARPLTSADRQLSTILHGFLDASGDRGKGKEPDDLVAVVKSLIEKNLHTGVCSIDAVARFLPYSRSTLQRKLSEHGTSYQYLLDDIRQQLACDALVQSNVSIGQLSDALGYANIAAFSRAFKKHFGCSPRMWRNTKAGAYLKKTTIKHT